MSTQTLSFSDNMEALLLDIEQTILALEQHPTYKDLICTTAQGWQNIRGVANLFNHDNITRLAAQLADCFDIPCQTNKGIAPELVKAAITMVDLIRHSGDNDLEARPTHNMAATLSPFSTAFQSSPLIHDRLPRDTKILIIDDETVNRTLL